MAPLTSTMFESIARAASARLRTKPRRTMSASNRSRLDTRYFFAGAFLAGAFLTATLATPDGRQPSSPGPS